MRLDLHGFFRNRINLFYLLALAPLVLLFYFGFVKRGDVVTWMIPFYGFLLLYMKRDKLTIFAQVSLAFKVIGSVLILVSFFVYYIVVGFYSPAQFYGEANYLVHIIGLFLVFFKPRALREAFTALFLIVGATAIPFFGLALENYLWPAIPFFVQVVGLVLRVLGIPVTQVGSNVFALDLPSSSISLSIIPACISIYSVSTFSILIAVTLIEDPSSDLRTKTLWAIGGVIGTFFLNLVRVSFIFVVIYYFGYENWPAIHAPIGYVLFLTWIGCFFLVFSKRQALKNVFQSLLNRLRKSEAPPMNF
jgi:exosortase/archaeosortase family protein